MIKTINFLLLCLCAAVIADEEECVDKKIACSNWAKKGLCKIEKYFAYMQKYCQKSCGFCDTCVDKMIACNSWARQGFCIIEKNEEFVRKNCPKSCGFCMQCKDKLDACSSTNWLKKGYCKAARYQELMRKQCKKTCGFCDPPVDCGRPEISIGGLVAGQDAIKGAWPWQILLRHNGSNSCGGSLILPNWVVTAAHCVSGKEINLLIVRVGEHDTSKTNDGHHRDLKVDQIIPHPDYDPDTNDYDIALMKLESPVIFNKFVKPVCLPKQGHHVAVGTTCFITGWGETHISLSDKYRKTILQEGRMKVKPPADCKGKERSGSITDNMICGGSDDNIWLSGCRGDSGGPFVCKTGSQGTWVLHGVVSFGGRACDALDNRTVFIKVANLRSWIDEQIKNNW